MSKLKKGDRVKRTAKVNGFFSTRSFSNPLRKGDVRTVTGRKGNSKYITLEGTGSFGWDTDKFKKVDTEIEQISKNYNI